MPAQSFVPQNEFDKIAKLVWILWNRDLRNTIIEEGGIKVFKDGALVGTVGMIGETVGLGYQYDGAVTSAAAVAAIHKANLAAHTTDLASQLGSINYLNEQKNLHAATLAAHGSTLSTHGTELSSQAGSINYLAGIATGHSGQISTLQSQMSGVQSDLSGIGSALSSLQSTVGGMPDYGSVIGTILSRLSRTESKISQIENYLSGGGTGPFNPGA
ncbi:hypothetical protein [Pseudoclavibacter sp. JSM 162008]|uniref:hypothetical protein n=1 Tax=Pseudoclavibacter sp. JSM 162008 TaxID=3229855 RepID=UPI003523ACAC